MWRFENVKQIAMSVWSCGAGIFPVYESREKERSTRHELRGRHKGIREKTLNSTDVYKSKVQRSVNAALLFS